MRNVRKMSLLFPGDVENGAKVYDKINEMIRELNDLFELLKVEESSNDWRISKNVRH